MRVLKSLLVCLALVVCVVAVIGQYVSIPNGKPPVVANQDHVVMAPSGTVSEKVRADTDPFAQQDPVVTQTIEEQRALLALYDEFRAAKLSGEPISTELADRLARLRTTRPRSGPLDQGGEDCANATGIAVVPYTDFGTTVGYLDDLPECDGEGTGPDVTYVFAPATTADFHISLCGSSFDTKLAVYETACTGIPIACNDDGACWPGSDIPRITLNAGTTYYFVIDGWNSSFGDYAFFFEELPPVPQGDDCADPVVITALPYNIENVSSCVYGNDFFGTTCLCQNDEGPDVIFSFTLTTTTSVEVILTAHYNTPPQETWVMPGILLSNHCPPDWDCIAYQDPWTVVDYIPLVLPCASLSPGTYWIMVDNGTWFHPCFTFDLQVRECGPCDIVSQPGDVAEVAEPFPLPGTYSINDPNGGCDNDDPYAPQYQTVTSGQSVFGRTFAYTDSITSATLVDHDWYRFVVTTPVNLTCTYTGETSLLAAFYEPPCPSIARQYGIQTTPCGTRSLLHHALDPANILSAFRAGYHYWTGRCSLITVQLSRLRHANSLTADAAIQAPVQC
ncbi:MAG: hypothetical protein IPG71_00365 [bacterium]|nr:hypothetical protein [bacterium]